MITTYLRNDCHLGATHFNSPRLIRENILEDRVSDEKKGAFNLISVAITLGPLLSLTASIIESVASGIFAGIALIYDSLFTDHSTHAVFFRDNAVMALKQGGAALVDLVIFNVLTLSCTKESFFKTQALGMVTTLSDPTFGISEELRQALRHYLESSEVQGSYDSPQFAALEALVLREENAWVAQRGGPTPLINESELRANFRFSLSAFAYFDPACKAQWPRIGPTALGGRYETHGAKRGIFDMPEGFKPTPRMLHRIAKTFNCSVNSLESALFTDTFSHLLRNYLAPYFEPYP